MTVELDFLRQIFTEEAREHLATMERGLLALEETPKDAEVLQVLFRSAHSIKGASATIGLSHVSGFTHWIETILDALRDGRLVASDDVVTTLLKATDDLRRLIEAEPTGKSFEPDTTRLRMILERIPRQRPGSDPGAPASERKRAAQVRRLRITIAPADTFLQACLDPVLIFRELERLGTLEGVVCDLSRVPRFSAFEPRRCYVAWTAVLHTSADDAAIRDIFVFYEDDCTVTIAPDAVAPVERRKNPAAAMALASAGESSTLRVTSEKVDAIIDLVGELVIAQSMMMQQLSTLSVTETPMLRDAISVMTRNMQELQARVMGIRMVPVSTLFGRFARMVRDTAASLGKTVVLNLEGQDTELDKAVVERLADPITHLVRNALDHGLETDEERRAQGKTEPAAICLTAHHAAGGIVIAVSDNGRGLDTRRIREKADSIGLTTPTETLSDQQVHALIFEPGFTTAERVSELSGRGVGMDVVSSCIDSLHGTISIVTAPSRGTTFEIRLPLTLAIMDGLLLRVEQQVYVLPLLAVNESFRPKPEAVKTVAGEGTVAMIRGSALPLVDLAMGFGLRSRNIDASKALVVVVEANGKRVGLVVDALIGQAQVVVKNIETHYRKVDGIMGATILGDGRVAFIVDIAGLVRVAWSRRTGQEAGKAA
ncbi:MAG TPA: chemotaxis protein CheA [Polyangiaceae bacterium]|nr:chemotaxis protein CheA [Polyangiaceae bacterium]